LRSASRCSGDADRRFIRGNGMCEKPAGEKLRWM
jgi:hypothetical protein